MSVDKTPTITAAEWREMEMARARRSPVKDILGRGKGQSGKRPSRKGSARRPTYLVQDVPGSHILENRDVRDPIIDFLTLNGWFARINWQGPFSYPGVPDIEAIRDGEVVMIECKRPGEQLSGDQVRFRDRWVAHGGKWILARSLEDVECLARR